MGTCDWKARKPFYKMGSRTVLQRLASIKWKKLWKTHWHLGDPGMGKLESWKLGKALYHTTQDIHRIP
jgi:hypothetical protein